MNICHHRGQWKNRFSVCDCKGKECCVLYHTNSLLLQSYFLVFSFKASARICAGSQYKLEVHGRARREAALRRKSECQINFRKTKFLSQ